MTDAEWIAIVETVADWPDRGASPSDKGMRALAREVVRLRKLADYGRRVLEAHRELNGDLDGGYLQDTAVECGLLAFVEVAEPCGENCNCAEYYDEFPAQCLRETEVAKLPHGDTISQAQAKPDDASL